VLGQVTIGGMWADTVVGAVGAVVVLAGVLWLFYARRHYTAVAWRAVRNGRRLPHRRTVGMAGAGALVLAGLSMEAVAFIRW
jgi:uncharacterized membrane protein YidH (DUF202 family)